MFSLISTGLEFFDALCSRVYMKKHFQDSRIILRAFVMHKMLRPAL